MNGPFKLEGYPRQDFPAWCNVTHYLIGPILIYKSEEVFNIYFVRV
jgi:hypothetical protein